jgi:hypothetical protein
MPEAGYSGLSVTEVTQVGHFLSLWRVRLDCVYEIASKLGHLAHLPPGPSMEGTLR